MTACPLFRGEQSVTKYTPISIRVSLLLFVRRRGRSIFVTHEGNTEASYHG